MKGRWVSGAYERPDSRVLKNKGKWAGVKEVNGEVGCPGKIGNRQKLSPLTQCLPQGKKQREMGQSKGKERRTALEKKMQRPKGEDR